MWQSQVIAGNYAQVPNPLWPIISENHIRHA
jgi:hypothetical protein